MVMSEEEMHEQQQEWEKSRRRESLLEEFLRPSHVFAVVGATPKREKYGYKIFKSLKEAGYKVYAVNPNHEEIEGERCYASLSELPEKPDVVDIVVPPAVTEQIVREAHRLGIKKIWMQPGAESEEAIKFCEEHGISVIHGLCVMLESLRAARKREI
ncbi:MAG: putative CoA-binding protein [Methanophagales archaeon]|nr:CoA-binding protein [Methanophagales archaeon]MCU4140686.1 putative CoA-binding protein [Methanophagales archaeon]MCW7075408.1 CoA-binding protein [Candidatus Methanospirare jalkutatii]